MAFPFFTDLKQFLETLWSLFRILKLLSSQLYNLLCCIKCHINNSIESLPMDFGLFGQFCSIVIHSLIQNSWDLSKNLLEIGLKLRSNSIEQVLNVPFDLLLVDILQGFFNFSINDNNLVLYPHQSFFEFFKFIHNSFHFYLNNMINHFSLDLLNWFFAFSVVHWRINSDLLYLQLLMVIFDFFLAETFFFMFSFT